MSTKTVKLTSNLLRKLIDEEVSKFGPMDDVEDAANDAEETDADEYADALDKHIDYIKALKIEEARLISRVKTLREQRATAEKIVKSRKKS